jgi:hypothetical protein
VQWHPEDVAAPAGQLTALLAGLREAHASRTAATAAAATATAAA